MIPVAHCACCGANYDAAAFGRLLLVGHQDDDDGGVLELRDCPCRTPASTISRPLTREPDVAHAARVSREIRLMRGQIVIREEVVRAHPIWTPEARPRDVVTHTGRVLACGPPARTASGAEVELGFGPGDLVQFHFTSLETLARNTWEDGAPALWIPQQNVDAVWYEPPGVDA